MACELLALLKSLADQVYPSACLNPSRAAAEHAQRPFRSQAIAEKGTFNAGQNTCAWYQLRVLDLPSCLGALSYSGPDMTFQLRLEDPMDGVLAAEDLAEKSSLAFPKR